MANLTANAPVMRIRYPNKLKTERFTLDNSAANTIYYGQPVIIDASADTVNVRGWTSSITLVTANDIVIGLANEKKVALTTDIETDNEVEVITAGEVGILSSVFTDADLGKKVSFSDSGTLVAAAQAANRCEIGTLVRVEDGYAFIKLTGTPLLLSF